MVLVISTASILTAALLWWLLDFLAGCCEIRCQQERWRGEEELPARRVHHFDAFRQWDDARRVAAAAADAAACATDPSRHAFLDWIDHLPPITAPARPLPTPAVPQGPLLAGVRLPQSRPAGQE